METARHATLTQSVIGAFFQVYNRLGFGFLEAHYAAALERELRKLGLHVLRECAVQVFYDGVEIGFHRLDMVVEGKIVAELKSGPALPPHARRQLYSYLRATSLEVGVLLYFGPQLRFQRMYVPNPLGSMERRIKQEPGT